MKGYNKSMNVSHALTIVLGDVDETKLLPIKLQANTQ
ncbi:MAG: hypothetical protein CM15mP23_20280 [Cryomorphaceae bacterium]|nr:MAG: hypothetical protein CM15mP23_20280 [Cryomorphaceae bacterium]